MEPMVRLNVHMKSSGAHLSIGEVAEQFGLATHVLRHWEAMGLLSPTRAATGHRLYDPTDLYRVAAILQAKEAGLALDDIRIMLTTSDPAERTTVLRTNREDLVRRIAEAQQALGLIETALKCRHDDLATCSVFQAHLAERVEAGR
jgi:MerR family copper efflux transcriptional regulator